MAYFLLSEFCFHIFFSHLLERETSPPKCGRPMSSSGPRHASSVHFPVRQQNGFVSDFYFFLNRGRRPSPCANKMASFPIFILNALSGLGSRFIGRCDLTGGRSHSVCDGARPATTDNFTGRAEPESRRFSGGTMRFCQNCGRCTFSCTNKMASFRIFKESFF